MNVWFIGNGFFASLVLKNLIRLGLVPNVVCCGQPSVSGRGKKLTPQPVEITALELGLPCARVEQLNQDQELLMKAQKECDVLFVVDFGQKISRQWIDAAKWGTLNVHPSILPRWRGAAPLQRALLEGDEYFGLSVFLLTEQMDAGPVWLTYQRPAVGDETLGSLFDEIAQQAAELIVAQKDQLPFVKQVAVSQTGVPSYAKKLAKEERLIDPVVCSVVEAHRKVRAFAPKPGAVIQHQDLRLTLLKTSCVDLDLEPGLLTVRDEMLVLGCAQGTLRLDRVVPAGKKEMDGYDWARGNLRGAVWIKK